MATMARAAAADIQGRTTPPVSPCSARDTRPCPSATKGSTMGRNAPRIHAAGDHKKKGRLMTANATTTSPR